MKCNQNRETSIRSPGFSLLNTHRLSVFGSILNHNLWSLEESQYMRVSKKSESQESKESFRQPIERGWTNIYTRKPKMRLILP